MKSCFSTVAVLYCRTSGIAIFFFGYKLKHNIVVETESLPDLRCDRNLRRKEATWLSYLEHRKLHLPWLQLCHRAGSWAVCPKSRSTCILCTPKWRSIIRRRLILCNVRLVYKVGLPVTVVK